MRTFKSAEVAPIEEMLERTPYVQALRAEIERLAAERDTMQEHLCRADALAGAQATAISERDTRNLKQTDELKQLAQIIARQAAERYELRTNCAAAIEHAAHLERTCAELRRRLENAQISTADREIVERMAEDWLERFEPGGDEWADAQVIRSWPAEDMLVAPANSVASLVEVQQARLFAAVYRSMEAEYGSAQWWPDASRALAQYWRIEMHKAEVGQPATKGVE